MNKCAACLCLILTFLLAFEAIGAEEKKPDFTEAVVKSAIGLMPKDLQAKLSPVTKEIVSSAKPKIAAGKPEELYYFAADKKGTSPEAFTETFRQARKAVGEKKEVSAVAPMLGRLAFLVVSLSQPYRSDETAYKSEQRAAFEKQLDAAAPTLKAGSEGIRKISNPSDFAIEIAKKAGEQLTKLKSSEGLSSEVSGAVLTLAANSLASTWSALLAEPDQPTGSGNFIGNKRSLKFHLPTCKTLPAEKNRVYFQTRDAAINEGYVPCKVCKP